MYEYITIKENEKPNVREKFLKYGIEFLTDGDLITLILGSGTKKKPVQKLAQEVLKIIRFSNSEHWFEKLLKVQGIGNGKACLICAALEFGSRYNNFKGKVIRSCNDVIPLVQFYALQQQEHFICISLNGGHEIINIKIVSIGTVNKTIIHPREVFADPLKDRAVAVIVCHNHPSNNVQPSKEDIDVTTKLFEAAEILGIKLLDHIIISTTAYFSFEKEGIIQNIEKILNQKKNHIKSNTELENLFNIIEI